MQASKIAPACLAIVLAACSSSPSSPPTTPAGSSAAPATAANPASTPGAATPQTTPAPVDLGATGKGVTLAIFDRGIDWRNPEFIKPDGTTRIRWLLDMSGQTNYCSDGRPKPVEYSAADINAALQGGTDLDTRDAVGHGTATAGLAAGNGRSLASGRYRGVAPGADLIIVKVTSEATPAHDGVPAREGVAGCLDEALAWADRKITDLGQPAVGIWNAGTQWGPLDGTSVVSRAINQYFPPDKPGRIWVASSGDEGGLPNHAGGEATSSAAFSVPFRLTADRTFPTAWYDGGALSVTIELSDGVKVGPVGTGASKSASGITITQYRPGEEFSPWTSTSGDRAVWMSIEGHRGATGTVTFSATSGDARRVDVYGDVLGPQPLTSAIEFTDHLVPGRLTDVSTTKGVIVTGVSVALDSFTDVDGRVRSFAAEGRTGELWIKSSGGPTRDGRDVVDIAAAGQNIPAPLAAGSWWSSSEFRSLWPADGEGKYIRFGGTSAAGPIVMGTIALLLEINPRLTTEDVRRILRETATSDGFTGPVPNPDWGYGKLDIAAAVAAARAGR